MPSERYDAEVDLGAENNSHTMVCRAVADGSRVLDLGCATGQLAGVLTQRGCEVVGVEVDHDSAEIARGRCSQVVEADLETVTAAELADLGSFDVVIAADVLEHLVDPERLLREIRPLLAPGSGYLVASIPNVAHGSVRLALLAGSFPYQETGLLDSTHIRFYTPDSMPELLRAGGFEPLFVDTTTMPPLDGSALKDVDIADLPPDAVQAVRDDPDAWTYQFIVVAQPEPPSRGPSALLARAGRELDRCRREQAAARREFAIADPPETIRQLRESAVRTEASALLVEQRIAVLEQALGRAAEAAEERDRLAAERDRLAAELDATRATLAERAEQAEQAVAAFHASRLWAVGQRYAAVTRRLHPGR